MESIKYFLESSLDLCKLLISIILFCFNFIVNLLLSILSFIYYMHSVRIKNSRFFEYYMHAPKDIQQAYAFFKQLVFMISHSLTVYFLILLFLFLLFWFYFNKVLHSRYLIKFIKKYFKRCRPYLPSGLLFPYILKVKPYIYKRCKYPYMYLLFFMLVCWSAIWCFCCIWPLFFFELFNHIFTIVVGSLIWVVSICFKYLYFKYSYFVSMLIIIGIRCLYVYYIRWVNSQLRLTYSPLTVILQYYNVLFFFLILVGFILLYFC